MRVFVTGASGYVGGAVARAFAAAGHEVSGLVRTPEKAALVKAFGARPVIGDLRDPATYAAEAAAHDTLVHVGMQPGPEKLATDRLAVDTLLAAAREGGAESLIFTSVMFVLGDTGDGWADEDASTGRPAPSAAGRPEHERIVLDAADDRLATAVVRPGMVYGGRGGSVGQAFATAKRDRAALIVGDGRNRWPLIHLDDVGALYVHVAGARARGVFHAVDGTALTVDEIARAASRAAGAGGAVRYLPVEEARAFLGAFADSLALDQRIAAPRSAALGWRAERPAFPEWADEVYREWLDAAPAPAVAA
ncbi:MAG TPA: NAD-dependent epimerase/dehydratase family protein [Longimicrobium sp.]|nr:NAD-dependent epimerase/dehydratase family protein [Longimicrobium sp.]